MSVTCDRLFSDTLLSFTNKTDTHDIAGILFKVALNTITITPNPNPWQVYERANLCVSCGYHLSKQKLCTLNIVFVISFFYGRNIFYHLLYDLTVRDEWMVIWHNLERSNNILIKLSKRWFGFGFMVFNATFNNISAISLRSVLLVEEIRGAGENYPPVVSHCQTLYHNVVHFVLSGDLTHNLSGDSLRLHR